MINLSIDFDKYFFRPLDYIRIILKKIFTKLRLRDTQSCKHCGRDQWVIWIVKDEYWNLIPKKYHNKALCLECFIYLCPKRLRLSDFENIMFPYRRK
jgi:hypothetical protein